MKQTSLTTHTVTELHRWLSTSCSRYKTETTNQSETSKCINDQRKLFRKTRSCCSSKVAVMLRVWNFGAADNSICTFILVRIKWIEDIRLLCNITTECGGL